MSGKKKISSDLKLSSFTSLVNLLFGRYKKDKPDYGVFHEEKFYEKGFSVHYDRYIRPLANEYEKKRIQTLKKTIRRLRLATLLTVSLGAAAVYLLAQHLGPLSNWVDSIELVSFAIFFLVMVFAYLVFWASKSLEDYTKEIKQEVFPKIISFLGEFSFRQHCGERMSSLTDSMIIPSYTTENSEDEIIGTYKNTAIDVFQTSLQSERSASRNRNRRGNKTSFSNRILEHINFDNETYRKLPGAMLENDECFRGLVINLSIPTPFSSTTVVVRKVDFISKMSTTLNAGLHSLDFVGRINKNRKKTLDKVEINSLDFAKRYEIFSNDSSEAVKLANDTFLTRLQKLEEFFGGVAISCSFFQGKLLLMVPIFKNIFELGCVYEPEDFVPHAKIILAEMQIIFSIVDILNQESLE